MSTNLACLGLHSESEDGLLALLNSVEGRMRSLGRSEDGAQVLQWTDESGARLTIAVAGDDVVDLVASFAGRTGVSLAGLTAWGDFVAADVIDADGDPAVRLLCDLEQARFLREDAAGAAALTAFGLDVKVHANAAAAAGAEDGRMAPFRSFGLAGEPSPDAEPYAHLSATVVEAETRTNAVTGQRFHALQVHCAGMDLVMCLAAADHPDAPAPGSVVSGICFLAASVPSLWPSEDRPRPTR